MALTMFPSPIGVVIVSFTRTKPLSIRNQNSTTTHLVLLDLPPHRLIPLPIPSILLIPPTDPRKILLTSRWSPMKRLLPLTPSMALLTMPLLHISPIAKARHPILKHQLSKTPIQSPRTKLLPLLPLASLLLNLRPSLLLIPTTMMRFRKLMSKLLSNLPYRRRTPPHRPLSNPNLLPLKMTKWTLIVRTTRRSPLVSNRLPLAF